MTVTQKVANFVVETSYDDLPGTVVQYAKRMALSNLTSMIWGSTLPAGKIVTNFVREMGGTLEAGVIGSGFKAPPVSAALSRMTVLLITTVAWSTNKPPPPPLVWFAPCTARPSKAATVAG